MLVTKSPASGKSFTFGSGTWNPLVRLHAFGDDDMICIKDFQLSDEKVAAFLLSLGMIDGTARLLQNRFSESDSVVRYSG